ncbi:site-2 protease family protein [Paenibacillus thermoaerophilus]|uniref:Site-2 protease family protein n=1 Tax=Paenibacillus thermoaerophilus TaxID=1215385 RepID=A0ABW2V3H3_9BACL|nr:site-2 protease family protein [Paenibacillus thermoaerophilus]TMV18497.1 site-2 protease family protein [Paenibacillus thermoaerophilus]
MEHRPEAAGQREQGERKTRKPGWMLGAVLLFLLSKGKTALLLLSKAAGPILSMLVTIGAYAFIYPFGFALGFVVMILIHELGHVWAAKRKGLPVTLPMFIPFLGAFIALKRNPRDAETEAYIAYGGPLLGTIGALAAYAVGKSFDIPLLIAVAYVGFFLNLINLLPIKPLDGGRIATAVTRWLWPVGLVGGLFVILYLNAYVFLFFWALFAWDLYQKYVRKRRTRPIDWGTKVAVELGPEWAETGIPLPGPEHRRELEFTTYTTMEGVQKLTVRWAAIGLEETIDLPEPCVIRRVYADGVDRLPPERPEKLEVRIRIEAEQFENDRYFEVPARKRVAYGVAYGGLALLLGAMMILIQFEGLPRFR